jgi:predicted phage terminase large subunit-like protein
MILAADQIVHRKLSDPEFKAILERTASKARTDFVSFLHVMFPQTPDQRYKIGKVHQWTANLVQDILQGRAAPSWSVSMPPQHGKSRLIAVRAVAWAIGAFPRISIALTGFSHTLLTEFIYEMNQIVETERYRSIFPGVSSLYGRNRQDFKQFSNGSSVLCKSVGCKLTGRRVDLLIIDDALSGRGEAESASARDHIKQWYFADCLTRLSPNAKQFVIATRWHQQDLIGNLTDPEYVEELRKEGHHDRVFNTLNFPAIAEDDNDALGRMRGDPLFPQERPLPFLQGIRAALPEYEWQSQYQGNPQTARSGQVNTDKIVRISLSDVPKHLERVRGWDLALTIQKASNYSAGPLCAYDKEKDIFYIIDMFHDKLVWPHLKPKIVSMALADKREHGLQRIGMEAVAGFIIGLEEVRKELMGEVKVECRNPMKDKLLRAQPWLNKVEAGKVCVVKGEWNRKFFNELIMFPDSENDDQVDGVSICWEMATLRQSIRFA